MAEYILRINSIWTLIILTLDMREITRKGRLEDPRDESDLFSSPFCHSRTNIHYVWSFEDSPMKSRKTYILAVASIPWDYHQLAFDLSGHPTTYINMASISSNLQFHTNLVVPTSDVGLNL